MPYTLAKYHRYGRLAYRYGPTAYRYGKKIARWAASRYRNRYKYRKGKGYLRGAKRMRFSPKSFGESVGSSLTKQRQIQLTNTVAQDSRTLYTLNLTAIPHGQNRNERERSLVNYRGCRIVIAMKNERTVPLYINWALVHPKVDEATSPSITNFFRSPGSDRGLNFSTALTALQFHSLRINTDKFTILKHKRYTLTPDNNTADYGANSGWSFKTIDWYTKIKRQLRFEDTSTTLPVTGNVYLVHWADSMFDDSSQAVRTGAFSIQEDVTAYFRDAKN